MRDPARRCHTLPGAEFRMGEARERHSGDNGAAPDA